MKTILHTTTMAALLTLAATLTLNVRAEDDLKTLKAESEQTVQNFIQADSGLKTFFTDSAAYVILPSVGEGGFIIGGARGKGLAFEKGAPIGKVTLSAVSVGAQVGGGSFSEVVFFDTADAFKTFKEGKYTMSAQAKANAVASGVAANAKYAQGVAVFTMPKSGAMVAAAVGGQKFTFEPLK